MKAYVFPGQGSQVKGMGKNLFPLFPDMVKKADEILGYSIEELCLEDPEGKLGNTQYTQPALYIVNALSYLNMIQKEGEKPEYLAGHSLGEYDALFAAGVFDFETGLKLVKKRGLLMSQTRNGGMAAVVGIDEAKVREVFQDNSLDELDLANLNTPYQNVISGPIETINQAKEVFERIEGVRYLPLTVSGAFHSRYMEDAKKKFSQYLDTFELEEPKIKVISNYTARCYKKDNLKNNLIEQITGSVRWTETICYMWGKGIEDIIQVGPGNVLTGMIRRIKKEAEPLVLGEEEEVQEDVIVEGIVTEDILSENSEMKTGSELLGCQEFKDRYHLKYAYLAGGMYRGISSAKMVISLGKAGMMGFLGCGGMRLDAVEQSIDEIQRALSHGELYGLNYISNMTNPRKEEEFVDLLLRKNVTVVEASAFLSLSSALIRFRLSGLKRDESGNVLIKHHVIAKLSRPEVASLFLNSAPDRIINSLLEQHKITQEEAELGKLIPVADDITVESDSGGHTDAGIALVILPTIVRLRDEICNQNHYKNKVCIGAAGGLGTPEAVYAAYVLGADYIVTGSINQCSVEAETSDVVKDMLQEINIQDTEYAAAGDMFELGAKVQVLKKGVFFSTRANKLSELYRQYESMDQIDEKTKGQLQERFFHKSFDEIFNELSENLSNEDLNKANRMPKYKMLLIFKWYFKKATEYAIQGNVEEKVNYQIQCGPALGAFNQWVKGTTLENWKNRKVVDMGLKLMDEAYQLMKHSLV